MGAYLYGDLSPNEMREVRFHTQECPQCREELEARGRVVSSLDNKVPELSDTDRQSIAWTVKGAIRHAELSQQRAGLRWAPALAVGVVMLAGLAAGVLLSTNLGKPPPSKQAAAPRKQERSKAVVKVTPAQPQPSPRDQVADTASERDRGVRPERRYRPSASQRMAAMMRRGVSLGAVSRNDDHGSHDAAPVHEAPVRVVPDQDAQKKEPGDQGIKLPKPNDLNNAQTSTGDQPQQTTGNGQ